MIPARVIVLQLLLVFASTSTAQVAPVREIAAPAWDRGGEDDLFGYALALDGQALIVGIPGAPTTSAPGVGMVEVYTPSMSGWQLGQRVLPLQNPVDEKFGISLAVSADDLAVGSWDAGFGNGETTGSVHLYRRQAGLWVASVRLAAAELDAGDGFGSSLAMKGDWLAVAAPGYDDVSGVRGAVFLYLRTGTAWALVQRIEGTDSSRPGGFGCALALAADRLYVGDCLGDGVEANTGAVFWYALGENSATLGGQLSAPDLGGGDRFGAVIAASASDVVIAASVGNANSGSTDRLYFYQRDEIGHSLLEQQPLASIALSMQLQADRLLVAGPVCASLTTPGRNISCVRRYQKSAMQWTEAAPYLQQPEVGFNGFGWAIAADAATMHVGNPFRDVAAGPSSGAVSQFALVAPELPPDRLELPASLWRFAFNTVVDGDLMLASDARLGVPDDFNEGVAWLFDISQPAAQLLQRIEAPEPYSYERFASDVGIAGDHIVLSAFRRVPGGTTVVLRSYQRNGTALDFIDEFDLFSIPELAGLSFGTSFRISNDRLAMNGSLRTSRGRLPRLAVLRRVGSSWLLEALLQPAAQEEQQVINSSRLAMHGDRLAVLLGEIRSPPAEPRAWVVFVYRRNGTSWTLEQEVRPAADDPPATLLLSLALQADELALATGDVLQNALRTRVHTFRFDGANWLPSGRIEAPAGVSEFGRQLDIEQGSLVVESFPVGTLNENFVTPLRLYRADGANWFAAGSFLPQTAPAGQGRIFDFGVPRLSDGRLFVGGRREGPGVTTHTHGVMFEFDVLDPLFASGLE